MEMKINSKDFRVKEEEEVNLKKLPTTTKPVYKSKEQHEVLLSAHVAQLSAQSSHIFKLKAQGKTD